MYARIRENYGLASSRHCICSVQDNLLDVKFSGISKCTEICYKDPVLEDRQWSAYIDRSPGQDSYSLVSLSFYWLILLHYVSNSYTNQIFTIYSAYCYPCTFTTSLLVYIFNFPVAIVLQYAFYRIKFRGLHG